MSSTTSVSPSPTDGFGESVGTPHGSNYFFGFLLTFVGLLIIFIICGLGSRRRFAIRRERELNAALEPGRFSNGKLEGEETPPFFEQPFVVGEERWSSLMPLSVTFFREKEGDPVTHDLEAASPATPARSSTYITGHIIPWFNNSSSLPTPTDPDSPDTIQVAVMIIMPCRDMSPKNSKVLPEYQIGEISLSWNQSSDPHPNL